MYGKVNEYIPKWHTLMEMQSNNLTTNTPGCAAGTPCNTQPSGTAAATTMFREAYIDFRPMPSIAPNLNVIRMGVFRMPFGIFTEQSGGLRDVISSPYLNSVGSGGVTETGRIAPSARSTSFKSATTLPMSEAPCSTGWTTWSGS